MTPSEISKIQSYLRKVNADESARNPMVSAVRGDDSVRAGDQRVQAMTAEIVDVAGAPLTHAETGTTFGIRIGIRAAEEVLGPNVRVALQHDSGTLLTMLSNHRWGVDFGVVSGDHTVSIGVTDNPLLPGRYRAHIDIFDHTGAKLLDSWNDAVEFAVRSPRGEIGQGLVELPVEITFD